MAYVSTQPMMPYRPYRGMGDAASDARIVQSVSGVVGGPVIGILAAHAATVAAATGGTATLAGMSLGVAVPVIGAALVGATMLAVYLIQNSGCGQTCIITSQWANKAEDLLKQNLAAYFALPAPRPQSAQKVALANFDAIWATLQAQCGQEGTGNAGVRCITDRQAGACKWRSADGQCFNWFIAYRDSIQNDPAVPDSITTAAPGSVDSLLGGSGGSSLAPLLLIGALVVAGVML